MENYLYILPFKDKKHFKVGISSNNMNRIKHLNSIYSLDYDNGFILQGKEKKVKMLETMLLSITNQVDTFIGNDGHTEVRSINDYDKVIEQISLYEDAFKLKKEFLNKPIHTVKPKPKLKHNNIKKEKPPIDYEKYSYEIRELADKLSEFLRSKKANKVDKNNSYYIAEYYEGNIENTKVELCELHKKYKVMCSYDSICGVTYACVGVTYVCINKRETGENLISIGIVTIEDKHPELHEAITYFKTKLNQL